MKLLINKQQKSYKNSKTCYISKEKSEEEYAKDKRYCKAGDHCHYTGKYRGTARSLSNLKNVRRTEE